MDKVLYVERTNIPRVSSHVSLLIAFASPCLQPTGTL
jgi:hypothetical protein